MADTSHNRLNTVPGGAYSSTELAKNKMGPIPNFANFGPSLGKNPSAGSFIGLCFYPKITGLGYMAVERDDSPGTKMRILLTDHPDGG